MNKFEIRITYRDTDQMGMVYYANYLVFFEMGRTELFRQLGMTYKSLEEKQMYFPVIHAECNYHAPAKYDDLITIETKISEVKNASIIFSYEIKCCEKLLVSGSTKHPLVDKSFKPVRMPKELKDFLQQHLQ